MAGMTEHELNTLADKIVEKMSLHPPTCLSFDKETIGELNNFAKMYKKTREKAWTTLVSLVVVIIFGLIISGTGYKFWEYITNFNNNLPKKPM